MRGPVLRLLSAGFTLFVTATAMATNKNLKIRGDYVAGTVPQIDADGETIKWVTPASISPATVTSVGLSLPTNVFSVSNSPVTGSGDLTAAFVNQGPNLIFAGPASGAATAAPTFRSIVAADLPIGTTAGTVAAGNDGRIHLQNTDTGTTSLTFQIGGATGPKIKANSGAFELRNDVDNGYVDLVLRNLIVQGTTTTVNSEVVTIADNQIVLNSDFTGATPTENGGILVKRGTQTNAAMTWNEVVDRWTAGLEGAELNLARQRVFPFTAASLTAGVITIAHNLDNQYPDYRVYDNANKPLEPADLTATNANSMSFDFNGVTVTGTYTIVITG